MSQTTQHVIDPYLAAQKMPQNDIKVDPKYLNCSLVTPIGRFINVDVAEARAIKQDNGAPGIPRFAITLAFAPGTNDNPIVADLYRAIVAVVDAKHPQGVSRPNPATGNMEIVRASDMLMMPKEAGGFHYPLRNGNEMWMKKPEQNEIYRGTFFINASMMPKTRAGADQRPVCYDEQGRLCDPKIFYRGCYGRAYVRCAWFENKGNLGVTFYLESVQFARHGEKLASFNSGAQALAAFQNAGAIPIEPSQFGDPGTGNNTAGPTSVPPGFAAPPQAGFAAPPVQAGFAAPQAQPSMPTTPIGPQTPVAPSAGYRPPGT